MPRVDLRDYRKARTPFGSLMRLFRYFKHCRLILVCAVVSILVYAARPRSASRPGRPPSTARPAPSGGRSSAPATWSPSTARSMA